MENEFLKKVFKGKKQSTEEQKKQQEAIDIEIGNMAIRLNQLLLAGACVEIAIPTTDAKTPLSFVSITKSSFKRAFRIEAKEPETKKIEAVK